MTRSLRIIYAAGSGDVIGTYRHWKEGGDDPGEVSVTYSGQFYDVCRDGGHRAYVIGCNPKKASLSDGAFRFVYRRIRFKEGPGPLYHLAQAWSSLRFVLSALWYRADVAVVANGSGHWFAMSPLRWFGVRVIPSVHCVLWRKDQPPTGLKKVIARADGRFFSRRTHTVLSASGDITRQLQELCGDPPPRIVLFLPTYRAADFAACGPPPSSRQPFRVFFAGRIERDKGVFDLLAMAKRFADAGRSDIEFDLCGSGGALAELRQQAVAEGLASRFRCHGHCDKKTMRSRYADCHVVIVPTTSEFIEGFNQVVSEAVLAGRPVITSSVCPALEYVEPAVVEVAPDDVRAYGDSILRLCDDLEFYNQKLAGCRDSQPQFYDESRGWKTAFKQALDAIDS